MAKGPNDRDRTAGPTPVQSVERAFDILEILSHENSGLPLTEVSRRLNLHKSTVYRLLATLGHRGYVEKVADTGSYKLGLEFIGLSSLYLNNLDLKVESHPYLMRLSQETGKTVFLAILQGCEVVYIDKVETFSSLRKYSIIGQRNPVYCTALGKSFLMTMEDAEIRELLATTIFEKRTEATAGNIETLLARVDEGRTCGWVLDDLEIEDDVRCVAAPILDYSNKAIAAVSVSWDINAHPETDVELTAQRVSAATKAISRRMGNRNEREN
jgi:IclR family transcriptional regulator, KDG regulon repressor